MSLKDAAEHLRAQGRGEDTELVHLTKREVRAMEGLAKAAGGSLTRNPKTGLPEAGFLDSLLPAILGTAANFIIPGSGMIVGGLTGALQNKDNPLMGAALGAAGGYGGGQLAQGLQGMGSSAISPEMLAQANAAADPIGALAQGADFAAASGMQAPTGIAALQAGAQNTLANPMGLVNTMGGPMATAKAAGLAAAPLLYQQAMAGSGDDLSSKMGNGEKREYDYDAGYTGGEMTGPDVSSERRWFTPQYTRRYAEGGQVQAKTESGAPAYNFNAAQGTFSPKMVAGAGAGAGAEPALDTLSNQALARLFAQSMAGGEMPGGMFSELVKRKGRRYAAGGEVTLAEGGFIIPADVVSMVGNGSSNAGLEALAQLGAQPIDGPGDGQSDDIPASIDGKRPARLARQEAYLPPEAVRAAGGARKLYKMLDRVRTMAHGKSQQQRPVELREALT